jgi:hypothetical protein
MKAVPTVMPGLLSAGREEDAADSERETEHRGDHERPDDEADARTEHEGERAAQPPDQCQRS